MTKKRQNRACKYPAIFSHFLMTISSSAGKEVTSTALPLFSSACSPVHNIHAKRSMHARVKKHDPSKKNKNDRLAHQKSTKKRKKKKKYKKKIKTIASHTKKAPKNVSSHASHPPTSTIGLTRASTRMLPCSSKSLLWIALRPRFSLA